jgi:hypothetical protein
MADLLGHVPERAFSVRIVLEITEVALLQQSKQERLQFLKEKKERN